MMLFCLILNLDEYVIYYPLFKSSPKHILNYHHQYFDLLNLLIQYFDLLNLLIIHLSIIITTPLFF